MNKKSVLKMTGEIREYILVDLCFTITYHPAPKEHPSTGGELSLSFLTSRLLVLHNK